MSRQEFLNLFLDELRDIYDAERQILQTLPKFIEASTSSDLKEAFQNHLKETREHVTRLDRIFQILNESSHGEICEAMQGLLKEGEEIIQNFPKSPTRDAGIISAVQRVEHYEMAVYGTLRTFAKELDLDEVADLLQDTLDEEGSTNKVLIKIAQGGLFTAGINEKARSR